MRRRWQWQLIVRVSPTGDPSGQEHPNCCEQRGAVLLPGAPSAQESGVGAVGLAEHRGHRLHTTNTSRNLVRLLASGCSWRNNTNCLLFISLIMLCPTSLVLPYHSLWSHKSLRFVFGVAGQPVRANIFALLAGDSKSFKDKHEQNCLKVDFLLSLPKELQVSITQAEHWAVSVEHGWEWASQGGADAVCSRVNLHRYSQQVPAGKLTLWPQALLYLVLIPLSISCTCQGVVPAGGQESHAHMGPQCSPKWG